MLSCKEIESTGHSLTLVALFTLKRRHWVSACLLLRESVINTGFLIIESS